MIGSCHTAFGSLGVMTTATLMGSGVYDAHEVSRLLAPLPIECIVRWAAPDHHGLPPVVTPTFDKAFAFVDLVSLAVAGELWKRRVAEDEMRYGVVYLQNHTGYDKPLSSKEVVDTLATSGKAFIAEIDGGWYDLGKGGQGAFKDVIRIYLEHLSFDDVGVARKWNPAPHVILDPRIQAGTPCIEGTRIPTETIAGMAEADPPEIIAEDLEIDIEEVMAALDFERQLREGQGLTV